MPSSTGFAFDFAGEDIDVNVSRNSVGGGTGAEAGTEAQGRSGIRRPQADTRTQNSGELKTVRCSLQQMLATLPSRISYASTLVVSPLRERKAVIPRRALFDVRMQIMAEDGDESEESTDKHAAATAAANGGSRGDKELLFGDSDIEQNVYEGGFKSWEGAMDLARLLLERGPRKDIDDLARVDGVVELGCGTALPTLILFQHALASDLALDFTLADYNASVLRLVTLPNLLLTWALQHSLSSFHPAPPSLATSTSTSITTPDGDLDITTALLTAFTTSLSTRGITLTLIAGPWSPTLTPNLTPTAPGMSLLVLAAETIYSPASLADFTATLLSLLRRARLGKALVAAKRIYFGVGGSVDGFKECVAEGGGVVAEVENSGVEGCDRSLAGRGGVAGVGRCLMDVQMY